MLTPHKAERLGELALRPARIAFDHIEDAEQYKKAIRLCAKSGITHMSNYLLYNGEDFTGKGHSYHADTPEDLYERMRISMDLCEELNAELDHKVAIFSFPMRYIPLSDLKRGFIGAKWNAIGDRGSCSTLFKEERFNGWMIGELYILDKNLIVNSRRDGFEKNVAYYELLEKLKNWALGVSKIIRHISYERSLSSTKKHIVEAGKIEDIIDENGLFSEELGLTEDTSESSLMGRSESAELAETDYISKLSDLVYQKKAQTKYTALNINRKLSIEQRRILERVFDLITQEYDPETAEHFVNTISIKF